MPERTMKEKQQDLTKWLTNNDAFSAELDLIREAEEQAKKELKKEARKWSAFNYKLA